MSVSGTSLDISALPLAVLGKIICALPDTHSRKPCTLVSRSWARAAYPRVFNRITLSEYTLFKGSASRGRYCAARLLNSLVLCSSFLVDAVKELFLVTFDSDGLTGMLLRRVLERFPGLDVFSYDVRHFVLSPSQRPRTSPPHSPRYPPRVFSKVYLSIGEYGTRSAFASFLNQFDEIDQLSVGHMELEEDGESQPLKDYPRVRVRSVVKEASGSLTSENMRILSSVLDTSHILSLRDETERGQFLGLMDDTWDNRNVRRVCAWCPVSLPRYRFHSGFTLSKFPALRHFELTMVFHVRLVQGAVTPESFATMVEILETAPSTLRKIEISLVMVVLHNDYQPINRHIRSKSGEESPASSFFRRILVPDIVGLNWTSFQAALRHLAGSLPQVRILLIVREPSQSVPVSHANAEQVNESLQAVIPSFLSDPRIRENVYIKALLCT